MLSQIEFGTNETKSAIVGLGDQGSYPILLESHYSKGNIFVLNIPDGFGQMLNFPVEVLNEIRNVLLKEFPINVQGKSPFGLFAYDSDTFIIHSFDTHANTYEVILDKKFSQIIDLESKKIDEGTLSGQQMKFNLRLNAGVYKAFKAIQS